MGYNATSIGTVTGFSELLSASIFRVYANSASSSWIAFILKMELASSCETFIFTSRQGVVSPIT